MHMFIIVLARTGWNIYINTGWNKYYKLQRFHNMHVMYPISVTKQIKDWLMHWIFLWFCLLK